MLFAHYQYEQAVYLESDIWDENNRLIAHGKGAIANELQNMSDDPVFNATRRIMMRRLL